MKNESKNRTNSLLSQWKEKSKKRNQYDDISKVQGDKPIPLSRAQQRLWFLDQLYPNNPFYNIAETYTFSGELDIPVIISSIERIIEEHDILRTNFRHDDKTQWQHINQNFSLDTTFHDLSDLDEKTQNKTFEDISTTNATKPFDLATDPLIRIVLIKLSANKHILHITLHHIITDKWSMGIFRKQLSKYYSAQNLNQSFEAQRPNIQYSDYSHWDVSKPINKDHLEYWRNKLYKHNPNISLPFDFKRPKTPSFKGKTSYTKIYASELSTKILNLAKQRDTTTYKLMLSVYYVLLYRLSNQNDISIGTPVTNREKAVLENIIGFFSDTLVLRMGIDPKLSFLDFLEKVKSNTLEAFEHKGVTFDSLVKELKTDRSISLNPFFQVMFLYHSEPENPSFSEDLQIAHNWFDTGVSKFDLTLYIGEDKNILSSTFEYSTDLFEESTINRFQDYFENLVIEIIDNPTQSIGEIDMLPKSELEFYNTTFFGVNSELNNNNAIHHIIEQIALRDPTANAVTFNDKTITYEELNTKAYAVARMILSLAPRQNVVIGLCVDRSIEMIIGMLGILKAGFCYMPLDPEYPKERTKYIINDSDTKLIITSTKYSENFEFLEECSILIIENCLVAPRSDYSLPQVQRTDLAYLIYTSGSTGKPKGVAISHGNIINSTAGRLEFYNKNPEAFLLMSSMSFDSSKAGIFWTLCTGGNLVITEKRIEQDINKIGTLIKKYAISHTLMLPSLYNLILEYTELENLKSLTDVIVAGEACSLSVCEAHFNKLPEVNLYNEYGPTEGTVWCTAHKITDNDIKGSKIPIGKPVANTKVYILDENFNHVPQGVSGGLFIAGRGLSKGYINNTEKTKEVFIENPNNSSEIIYKTGDLVKYDNNRNIIFLGRTDEQIKIRGYRVELGEIEGTINQLNDIDKAIVIPTKNDNKTKLLAFIKPTETLDKNKVKAYLKRKLPSYMIPSTILELEEIPLLPNGKINKTKLELLKPVQDYKNNPSDIPKTEIEKLLIQLWQDVLEIPNIGINDNFFEIGGDSILSIQITAKARKHGIKIGPNQIFEHQTISDLAMVVAHEIDDKIIKNDVYGEVSLMPIQKWFFDTHQNAPGFWNQAFAIHNLPNNANEKLLKNITEKIIEHHEALRSSFKIENSKWKAFIKKKEDIESFYKIDISKEDSYHHTSLIETHLLKIQNSLKLDEGGLFKCILFDTGNIESNVLILLAHHLVIDFVSWQIIINHFEDVIFHNDTKTFKTASIKDWGTYLLELNNSENIKQQTEYWRSQIPPNESLPVDFPCDLPIMEKDTDTIVFNLDEATSTLMMSDVHNTYNTKTDELLLVALALTISNWMKKNKISLALERHGRETTGSQLDLSNTIGWLTAFFPKTLYIDSTRDIGENIIAIKEDLRNIEMGGLGYGILRYFSKEIRNAYPRIIFNYLGRQSNSKLNLEFLNKHTRHPKSERHYFLEINALIEDNKLIFNWSYANKAFKTETITQLAEDYKKHLKEIIHHCLNSNDIKYTPSDFKDIDLDQDDLDTLFDSINS